jgi:hypothetical protein
MSRFIKLTNVIVNTNYIHEIIIKPNKYYIMSKKLDGFELKFAGSGIGWINQQYEQIVVCETKDPIDYKIVSDWINKL